MVNRNGVTISMLTFLFVLLAAVTGEMYPQDDVEHIDSAACTTCHETSSHNTDIYDDISHSIHEELVCLDCHTDKAVVPHQENKKFRVGSEGCRSCHQKESEEYQGHGHSLIDSPADIPQCHDCHGDHDILPANVKLSKVHPVNLPNTCGKCHENLDLTTKYDILIDHPIQIYQNSVHGKATKGGVYVAATCNDCHSTGETAHKILSPGYPESSINHFNIPATCGKCHQGVEHDFNEGIHGQLVARGETDAPVCTTCHGEHGIISPSDPASPVSPTKVAEKTCSPCHESTVLNEKYGLPGGRLTTFIDSYHGLKSKAGDTKVANCASCHGVHRILPSTDKTSTIYPANLKETCGECHPGISDKLAHTPIHGFGKEGLRTPLADFIAKIYIIVIFLIIGLMVLHWLIDLYRQIKIVLGKRPRIRRMRMQEVWQHTFLMMSFIVLVVSGFALRYSESWFVHLFWGREGGFEMRGEVHRVAAVIFILTSAWHLIYVLASVRGRKFFKDMLPEMLDFHQFWQRIMFNLGFRDKGPSFKRFSYVEKAEYMALIWGTAVMIITGLLLWFDNWFLKFLPKGALDIALVIHLYEAWLATLAIVVWHLYSTVFHPSVYPMNPSWITGTMPEDMYTHEHPEYVEEAKREEKKRIERKIRKMTTDDDLTDHEKDD